MKVKAAAKYIRISSLKAGQVLSLIRGQNAQEAQRILKFEPKGASTAILKVLDSAIANAQNNHGLAAEDLVVDKAVADQGPTLKRFRPRAMGRASKIRKRTSHITVVLKSKEGEV